MILYFIFDRELTIRRHRSGDLMVVTPNTVSRRQATSTATAITWRLVTRGKAQIPAVRAQIPTATTRNSNTRTTVLRRVVNRNSSSQIT